jgi:hypothetical protein
VTNKGSNASAWHARPIKSFHELAEALKKDSDVDIEKKSPDEGPDESDDKRPRA